MYSTNQTNRFLYAKTMYQPMIGNHAIAFDLNSRIKRFRIASPVIVTEEMYGMVKRKYVKTGDPTQMSCIVQGFPIPTVRWWHDERL